jgi:hypothetical protein
MSQRSGTGFLVTLLVAIGQSATGCSVVTRSRRRCTGSRQQGDDRLLLAEPAVEQGLDDDGLAVGSATPRPFPDTMRG